MTPNPALERTPATPVRMAFQCCHHFVATNEPFASRIVIAAGFGWARVTGGWDRLLVGDRLYDWENSIFFIALVIGSLAEGFLDGAVALFGKGGPCGFDLLSLITGLWHLPGMILCWPLWALSRPDGRDMYGYAALAIEYIVGALTFTILFYVIIRLAARLWRNLKHE